MQVAMKIMWVFLSAVALGAITLSAYFAYQFGLTRSDDSVYAHAAALLCLGLDLTKSGILIISIGSPRRERQAAVAGFWLLTFLSLWAAQGNSAQQLSTKVTSKVTAITELQKRETDLAKLEKHRATLVFEETSEDAVVTAAAALASIKEQVARESARGGCKTECRAREADQRLADEKLLKTQTNRAITIKAAGLDLQIEDARKRRDEIKTSDTLKSADAQSESISKGTGMSVEMAAMIGHWLFALAVEIGSGLLPSLLFASAHRCRQEGQEAPPSPLQEPRVEVQHIPLPETPLQVRNRFFNCACIPAEITETVSATEMHLAYLGWCKIEGIADPMPIHQFGTKPPWTKRKASGIMRYIGVRLAEAYKPGPRVVASNG